MVEKYIRKKEDSSGNWHYGNTHVEHHFFLTLHIEEILNDLADIP